MPEISRPQVRSTLAIPSSLSEVRKKIQEKPVLSDKAPAAVSDTPFSESDPTSQEIELLDPSAIQEVLDRINFEFREKGKHMEGAVIRQPFKIEGSKILFLLNGEIQKDIFEKLRPELTGILKQSLPHLPLEVSFQINLQTEDATFKLYTSSDKLRYLREKSPALKELQKRFGLETDF